MSVEDTSLIKGNVYYSFELSVPVMYDGTRGNDQARRPRRIGWRELSMFLPSLPVH